MHNKYTVETGNNVTTNTNDCENIDGGGWKLVRRVTSNYGRWHPATDDLSGTDVYGRYDNNSQSLINSYSIKFNTIQFNQFLFAYGDCSGWLVTTKFEAIGEYYSNENRCILNSSISNIPYGARWYNRATNSEDPWISLQDHSTSTSQDTMLYGENSSTDHSDELKIHNGSNVWIRYVENDTRYCFDTERPTIAPSSEPVYLAIGPYIDTSDRAMRYGNGGYGYDVDSCYSYCINAKYAYFALQNYINDIELSQCFCDNNLTHATKYGSGTCGEYGGGFCNYIYEIIGTIAPTVSPIVIRM